MLTDFRMMAAPGTTAPFGSATFPMIWPDSAWHIAVPTIKAIANTTVRKASPPVAAIRFDLVLLIIISFLAVTFLLFYPLNPLLLGSTSVRLGLYEFS